MFINGFQIVREWIAHGVSCVLFDLDGVIFPRGDRAHIRLIQLVIRELYGRSLSDEQALACYLSKLHGVVWQRLIFIEAAVGICGVDCSDKEYRKFVRGVEELGPSLKLDAPAALNPGAREMLELCANAFGVTGLAGVTATPEALATGMLDSAGVRPLLGGGIFASELLIRDDGPDLLKSEPCVWECPMAYLGARPETSAVIEDGLHGIEYAVSSERLRGLCCLSTERSSLLARAKGRHGFFVTRTEQSFLDGFERL